MSVSKRKCKTCGKTKARTAFYRLQDKTLTEDCLLCLKDQGVLADRKRGNTAPRVDQKALGDIARRRAAKRELASRELARRKLIPYIKRFSPKYKDGWVHHAICEALEEFYEQVQRGESPRLMIFVPPRHGKELAHTTPVLTPSGWTTHGALRSGDKVFGPDGWPTKVLALSAEEGLDEYEVELSNGEKIVAHAQHEWTVRDRRKGGTKWVTAETQTLAEDVWIGERGKRGGRARWQLPDVNAVQFPARKNLVVAPYVLGAWLGDGTVKTSCLTNSAEDAPVLQAAFAEAGYQCSGTYVHTEYGTHRSYFGRTGLTQGLRELGVFEAKHIPEGYLRGSVSQRLELLAGLMDTDGHVEAATGRCRLVTTSEALRDGIFDLCTTLGFRPYVSSVPAAVSSSGIEGRRTVYTVGFQPTRNLPTRLPRRQVKIFAVRRRVSIVAIRRVAGQRGRCIQVDRPDGLYLVGRQLVPTHNSEIASDYFPSWALGKDPTLEIIASSYSAALPTKYSKRNRERVRGRAYQTLFPEVKLHPENQNADAWQTTAGGGYIAAGVGGSLTGFGAHIFVIDDPVKDAEEADSDTVQASNWDWWSAVASTRVAPGGGVLVIQTRWADGDLSGRMLQQMEEAIEEESVPDEEIEKWKVLSFPAIADDDEYRLADGNFAHVEDMVAEDHAGAELVRSKGEALHPERWPLAYLKRKRRTMVPRHWNALYQQNPIPDEGDFFLKSDMRYANFRLHPQDLVFAAMDLAISTKKKAAYSVLVVGALEYTGRLKILDIQRGRWGVTEIVNACIGVSKRYGDQLVALGLEEGQIKEAVMPALRKAMRDERVTISMDHTLRPVDDKEVRARPLQGMLQTHSVVFPASEPWVPKAVTEVLRFPAGRYKDIVDALAWLARMALARELPPPPEHRRKSSWRDRLRKHERGLRTKDPMAA